MEIQCHMRGTPREEKSANFDNKQLLCSLSAFSINPQKNQLDLGQGWGKRKIDEIFTEELTMVD